MRRIDPAVAKAVLEQYPQFANILLDAVKSWRENIGEELEEGGKVSREAIASINAAINSLSSLLTCEDVSEEERDRTADRMVELAKLIAEVDRRNKDFIFNVLKIGGGVMLGIAAIAATVLGVNVKLPSAQDVRGIANAAKGVKGSL